LSPAGRQVRAGSARIVSTTVVKSVCHGERAGSRRVRGRLVRNEGFVFEIADRELDGGVVAVINIGSLAAAPCG
jgi:hypothetical protein